MIERPNTRPWRCSLALLLSFLILWPGAPAVAATLITPDEAVLPSAPKPALATRGISLGPEAEQKSPPANAAVGSPLHLVIGFVARNGVPIDLSTVTVAYMKTPLVDLTQRLKPYVTADGIDMPTADVPPGKHLIRLRFSDQRQRATTEWIEFTVAP